MFDNVETVERCAEVDAVQDHLSDIRVVDTGSLEGNHGQQILKHFDSQEYRLTWNIVVP